MAKKRYVMVGLGVRGRCFYHEMAKVYSETISLNFAANLDIVHMRANTKDQHMKEISFALQDIAEKML